MSWDGYTQYLVNNNDVAGAAIIGHNGVLWAATGLTISAKEATSLALRCADINNNSKIIAGGISYNPVGADSKTYYRLSLGADSKTLQGRNGQGGGICVGKSIQTYVVSVTNAGMNLGNCLSATERIRLDLVSKSF